jgi:hypothetical protein
VADTSLQRNLMFNMIQSSKRRLPQIMLWHLQLWEASALCRADASRNMGRVQHPGSVVANRCDLPHLGQRRGERQTLQGRCNSSEREATQVNCWSTGKHYAKTLQDKTATCKYGKLIGNQRKAKRKQFQSNIRGICTCSAATSGAGATCLTDSD